MSDKGDNYPKLIRACSTNPSQNVLIDAIHNILSVQMQELSISFNPVLANAAKALFTEWVESESIKSSVDDIDHKDDERVVPENVDFFDPNVDYIKDLTKKLRAISDASVRSLTFKVSENFGKFTCSLLFELPNQDSKGSQLCTYTSDMMKTKKLAENQASYIALVQNRKTLDKKNSDKTAPQSTTKKISGDSFWKQSESIISKWISTGTLADNTLCQIGSEDMLLFTVKLKPERRAVLHRVCDSLKIPHQSIGIGDKRQLVVSRSGRFEGLLLPPQVIPKGGAARRVNGQKKIKEVLKVVAGN